MGIYLTPILNNQATARSSSKKKMSIAEKIAYHIAQTTPFSSIRNLSKIFLATKGWKVTEFDPNISTTCEMYATYVTRNIRNGVTTPKIT